MLASIGAGSIPAHAEVPACATTMEDSEGAAAAALARQGKEALTVGRFEDAFTLFSQAFCRYPEPLLLHGLSAAELNLGRCDDALGHAQEWKKRADSADRSKSKSWLKSVREQCVELEIDSAAGPAELTLDLSQKPLGVTPWRGRLRAGAHILHATRLGYFNAQQNLDIQAGERETPLTVAVVMKLHPVVDLPMPGLAPPTPVVAPPAATVVAAPPPVVVPASGPGPSPEPTPKPEPIATELSRPPAHSGPPAWIRGPASPRARTGLYVGLAVAAAGVVVTGVSGATTLSAYTSQSQATTPDAYDAAGSTLRTRALAANVGIGLASAGLLTAVIFWFAGDQMFHEPPVVAERDR